MAKMIRFHDAALRSIANGVKQLAKAVIVTLGPKGRNVVINKEYGDPVSTKDGVTVAKEIVLSDKFENMGAQVVKEASSRTNDVAGDGTTTAIVLSEAIFNEGLKYVAAGVNPSEVKKGIDAGVKLLVEELTNLSHPVKTNEEISQVATISSNNDKEIGQLIADAMEKVGKDGSITTQDAKGIDTTLTVNEGMQFDKGYLSPYFVTNNEKMIVELENPLVLITSEKFSTAQSIVPLLEKASELSKPLFIIAEDIEAEALATLVVNKLKGGLSVCAVKAPGFGERRKEMLEDIAVLTGSTVISKEKGLSLDKIENEYFGSVGIAKVTKEETTLLDGKGDVHIRDERKQRILSEIERSDSEYDKEKLQERLAKLSGGVAVLHIGAPTETELKEKKDRVEDALQATKAAARDGIVAGGGVALIRASNVFNAIKGDEHSVGRDILKKAVRAPLIAIATNCGLQGDMVAEKVALGTGSYGFNGLTETYEDLLVAGVIDPVLVTKSALTHAASVATMLLTSSALVTDIPVKDDAAAQHPPMGGGMPPMGGMGMM